MKNSKAILLVTAACALSIGSASIALAQSSPQALSDQAQFEFAANNNWIATNLQKQVVAAAPTIQNRYNLATGYLLTGRLDQARSQFQALSVDGEGQGMEQGWRSRNFDVGMASADRVLYIDWLKNQRPATSGAMSADVVGTNVSATVGDYEVTDEQARALDRQAHASGAAH
uniref:hypothetical protein n=1 Tax=uncultured Caulobacter sp. TaxID=158749 RepID=UPI0025E9354A|nr:hypothetical protein [uncultured Caulobacter sp.]